MVSKITREMYLKKFNYKIDNCTLWVGESSYTYGFLPRKIVVSGKDGTIWEIKQTNWILKLVNALPILRTETFTPFECFKNGVYCGRSKKMLLDSAFYFYIKKDIYELRQHSNNMISLIKNNTQVALYTKKLYSELEKNEYIVKYSNDVEINTILLYCIFIDTIFYSNHLHISYYKREKNYVIKDAYIERVSWEPM